MNNKDLLKLLDSIQEDREQTTPKAENRVLLIDGLNLFFRNFAVLNYICSILRSGKVVAEVMKKI